MRRFEESATMEYKRELTDNFGHLSDNFTRIVFPYETGYSESPEISPHVTPDEGVNEGVNEGVRKVFAFVRNNPLCRVPRIAQSTGIPVKTVERYIRKLKADGKIEFTGAPKTGGYRQIAGEE